MVGVFVRRSITAAAACLVLACGLAAATPTPVDARRQVVQVVPQNKIELQKLASLEFVSAELDWWRLPSAVGAPATLHVAEPGLKALSVLKFQELTVLDADLGATIAAETARQATARRALSTNLTAMRYPEFYMNYEESMVWLLAKAAEYSDISTLDEIGRSYEGRPIYVLRVHGVGKKVEDKPEFYMQSVIHAR